jgi:hypothetical protein
MHLSPTAIEDGIRALETDWQSGRADPVQTVASVVAKINE